MARRWQRRPVLAAERPNRIAFADDIRRRVVAKLRSQPIEDYRIDFEDGYGNRPDQEEDGHAVSVAEDVATAFGQGTLPASIGIRMKPLSKELHARSLRTLDLFVTTLARRLGAAAAAICGHHSQGHDRRPRRRRRSRVRRARAAAEPAASIDPDRAHGRDAAIDSRRRRNRRRCGRWLLPAAAVSSGAHFGVYDYTALSGITAAWQHMRHPVCDFARHLMQVALAQSGVQLSDGGTNVMPIPAHTAAAGKSLTRIRARRESAGGSSRVEAPLRRASRHSLINGYYQGWDLHPAQLPTRYAAVYAFFQSARPAATARLRAFVEKASRATLVGDVFDDAATGQALLNFFVRGINSGAMTAEEGAETGLTKDELSGRSFLQILAGRK